MLCFWYLTGVRSRSRDRTGVNEGLGKYFFFRTLPKDRRHEQNLKQNIFVLIMTVVLAFKNKNMLHLLFSLLMEADQHRKHLHASRLNLIGPLVMPKAINTAYCND